MSVKVGRDEKVEEGGGGGEKKWFVACLFNIPATC